MGKYSNYKQAQPLEWGPLHQEMADAVGNWWLTLPLFPATIYSARMEDQWNLNLMISSCIHRWVRDLRDGVEMSPEQLRLLADTHFAGRGQENQKLQFSEATLERIDEIFVWLDRLPTEHQPAYYKKGRTPNRRLISTLALGWVAVYWAGYELPVAQNPG